MRTGRRKYYDLFAPWYDTFIRLHARRNQQATREALVAAAGLDNRTRPSILDICCGTGDVVLVFAEKSPASLCVGCDFARGMLNEAQRKVAGRPVAFIQGDATRLPFADERFDVITCSHALYELKGQDRERALLEMRRVLQPGGTVLVMEHEVPRHPVIKMLYALRMIVAGAAVADGFAADNLSIFRKIFSQVTLAHSTTGKSKMVICGR